jgi:hypothetical protein
MRILKSPEVFQNWFSNCPCIICSMTPSSFFLSFFMLNTLLMCLLF